MAALQFVIQLLDCESKQNLVSLEEDLKALSEELDILLKEE
jgi:hypothetical protein